MINNNEELKEHLNNFCKEKGIDVNIFEIARIGKGKGRSDRKVLDGPQSIKNKNCTYVIKLFIEYNLIIIWNYRNNPSMSYSYITINDKLQKGIFTADKGRETHTNNQSVILFEHSENFDRLLNHIVNKI